MFPQELDNVIGMVERKKISEKKGWDTARTESFAVFNAPSAGLSQTVGELNSMGRE
ncbi:MAG: hypothetical protein PWR17_1239 [Candidatus Methanomethylophilaceae archaeon]|nr:hypothetical protein [Candidatus Methanomethylophilaceae archaeon]